MCQNHKSVLFAFKRSFCVTTILILVFMGIDFSIWELQFEQFEQFEQ